MACSASSSSDLSSATPAARVIVKSHDTKGHILRSTVNVKRGEVIMEEAALISVYSGGEVEKQRIISVFDSFSSNKFKLGMKVFAELAGESNYDKYSWSGRMDSDCAQLHLICELIHQNPPLALSYAADQTTKSENEPYALRILEFMIEYKWIDANVSPADMLRVYLQVQRHIRRTKFDNGIFACIFEHNNYLSHACIPNSIVAHHRHTITLIALKPIQAEEELTIAYKPLESLATTTATRATRLDFKCNCEACTSEQDLTNHADMKEIMKTTAEMTDKFVMRIYGE